MELFSTSPVFLILKRASFFFLTVLHSLTSLANICLSSYLSHLRKFPSPLPEIKMSHPAVSTADPAHAAADPVDASAEPAPPAADPARAEIDEKSPEASGCWVMRLEICSYR